MIFFALFLCHIASLLAKQPPIKFICRKLWHLPPWGPSCPLWKGPLAHQKWTFSKVIFFSNFLLSYWTYLLKNMFIWQKWWFSFVAHNICLHQPVSKSWCQPGGEGGIFCQKLTEADKGGEGSKLTKFWLTSFVNHPLHIKQVKPSWTFCHFPSLNGGLIYFLSKYQMVKKRVSSWLSLQDTQIWHKIWSII